MRSVHPSTPIWRQTIFRPLTVECRRSPGWHSLGGQASEPAARAAGAAKMKRPHPVSLPLRYQSLGKRHVAAAGTGLTVAIGSRMAIFVAQHRLVAGSQVELFIDWPAKLMETTPLQLYMRGTVCGSEGERTLVAVENYVFKIKPPSRRMPAGACELTQAGSSAAAV